MPEAESIVLRVAAAHGDKSEKYQEDHKECLPAIEPELSGSVDADGKDVYYAIREKLLLLIFCLLDLRSGYIRTCT